MKRGLALLVFLLVTLTTCRAANFATSVDQTQSPAYPFAMYPAHSSYKGIPAPPRLVTSGQREFRTVLRNGAKKGPNFDGHYTVVQWGCGSNCVVYAVVDAKTGKVFSPDMKEARLPNPQMAYPCDLVYRRDSALLVIESSATSESTCEPHMYVWSGSQFVPETQAPSAYSDSKYGIFLRYPRNYSLRKGKLGEEDGLGYLGPVPMNFAAAGGIRVATVFVPDSLYPGTDFGTAFFTISVNQHLTRHECEQFPNDGTIGKDRADKSVSGIKFRGATQSAGGLGHQFSAIYYHGFSNGLCYEVGLGLATSGYEAVDGMKKVDQREVFATLDGIFRRAEIRVRDRAKTD